MPEDRRASQPRLTVVRADEGAPVESGRPEDFSGTEPSFAELSAQRQDRSTAWSPRDALIERLRKIDSGEIDPDTILILEVERYQADKVDVAEGNADFVGEPQVDYRYTLAGKDVGTFMIGVMERMKSLMIGSGSG